MGMPQDPNAYPECTRFMDKAMNAKKGGRLSFLTENAAIHQRFRCYAYRHRVCVQNSRIYPVESPMWNNSIYRGLVFKIHQLESGLWALDAIHDDELALESASVEYTDLD